MKNKATIAAVINTYNAEKYIRGCLDSIKWADEIFIMDSFSSDRTVEIAREYTNKIFLDKSTGQARTNIAIEKVTSEWILKIHATERIPDVLQKEILEIANKETDNVAYHVPRLNYFFGKFIEEKPGPIYLFKKGVQQRTCSGLHHEDIPIKGKVGYLKNFKIHWSNISIEQAIAKMNLYTSHDAKTVFNGHYNAFLWSYPVKNANIFNVLFRTIAGFFYTFIFGKVYRYGMHGIIMSILSSFYFFTENAKLWELQYKKKHNINDEVLPLDENYVSTIETNHSTNQ